MRTETRAKDEARTKTGIRESIQIKRSSRKMKNRVFLNCIIVVLLFSLLFAGTTLAYYEIGLAILESGTDIEKHLLVGKRFA